MALTPGAARAQNAQGLLPAYATDVRVGDLRTQFQRVFDANPQQQVTRAWTFQPSIDITESYDTGVQLPGHYGADYITRITPTLSVAVDKPRLTGTFTYNPTVNIYATHSSQNDVLQSLNTSATATLMENLLFVDLRGYTATQPILGGLVTPGTTGNKLDMVQTSSFSISPYVQKRFGDTASVAAGVTASQSMMSSLAPKGTAPAITGVAGNYTSQQEHASITSGPDFGRIQSSLSAVAMQYQGVGFYNGAHNETYSLDNAYAVSRAITLTAGIGHETIAYGPGGPKTIDDITWSGGFKLTPNADSSIDASYGRKQGGTGFNFDGTYAFSSRLRIMARYSQGVGSSLENLQNALAGTVAGPGGVPLDRGNGAPVALGGLLGQQQGIYRTTDGSINATYQNERDTVTLGFDSTDSQLISSAATTAGAGYGTNNALTESLTWQHELSEKLSTTATLQYGTRAVPGAGTRAGTSATESASVSLNYIVSETLSTNALISHSQTTGSTFGLPPTRDLALVGLHKAF
jgi:hypothetical protein